MKKITKESDPGRWEALVKLWEKDKRPGWLVLGSKTYRVIRPKGEVEFVEERGSRELYESTSF